MPARSRHDNNIIVFFIFDLPSGYGFDRIIGFKDVLHGKPTGITLIRGNNIGFPFVGVTPSGNAEVVVALGQHANVICNGNRIAFCILQAYFYTITNTR